MKRLRLLNDNVLGILLHVTLGIKQIKDGGAQLTFYKNQITLEEQFDLALLAKEKLVEIKTTLSPRTFIEGNYYKTLLRQKAEAAIVGSSHTYSDIRGTVHLREQAEKLERFLKYLKGKYGEDKNIEYEDSVKITKDFPEIEKTLFLCLSLNSQQIGRLKSYLKKYYKQYTNKDLHGQERLALPDIYAQAVSSKINTPSFLNTFGRKRVLVNKNNSPLFCHSIFYLQRKGAIKIRDTGLIDSKVSSITIDNLITDITSQQGETQSKQTSDLQERYKQLLNEIKSKSRNQSVEIPLVKPVAKSAQPNWSDDFVWRGNEFVFGGYGSINFSSDDRKALFKTLTDARGNWIAISKLKGNKNANYVRATIKQIEDRFTPELRRHVSIPSTQDDDLEPKPSQGAYRMRFSP